MSNLRKHQVLILDDSNYNIWLFKIKQILKSEKIDYLLKYGKQADVPSEKMPSWDSDNGKGVSLIADSLGDQDMMLIINYETVYEIMQFFEKRETKGASAYSLHEEFSRLEWSAAETFDQFNAKMIHLQSRMKSLRVNVDNQAFIHKIIDNLPSVLSDLKSGYNIEIAKGTVLVYDDVVSAVSKLYATKMKNSKSSLIVQHNRHQQQPQQQAKTLFCRYCKKDDHAIDDCEKLKKKRANNQQRPFQRYESSVVPNTSTSDSVDRANGRAPAQSQSVSSSSTIQLPPHLQLLVNTSTRGQKNDWLFDSGCADMMTPNEDDFQEIAMRDGETYITANGPCQSKGVGTLLIESFNGQQWIKMKLRDVQFMPTLEQPLFSEPAAKLKIISDPEKGELQLLYQNQVLFTGSRDPRANKASFVMNMRVIKKPKNLGVMVSERCLHYRIAHCPIEVLEKTIEKELVTGVSMKKCEEGCGKCEACLAGKIRRRSNTGDLITTGQPGLVVHVDSYTPKIQALDGRNTAIVFVDEGARLIRIELIKDKSHQNVKLAFDRFLAFQRKVLRTRPLKFHSDNGTEFRNAGMEEYLSSMQITASFSCAYVKQENGLAERTIGYLSTATASTMIAANLPRCLWNEVFEACSHLINIRYKKCIDSSPYFKYHGAPAEIGHFRTIGTYAYVHIPLEKQKKLGPRSKKMRLVNFGESSTVMRFYDPNSKRVSSFSTFTFLQETFGIQPKRAPRPPLELGPNGRDNRLQSSNGERVLIDFESHEVPSEWSDYDHLLLGPTDLDDDFLDAESGDFGATTGPFESPTDASPSEAVSPSDPEQVQTERDLPGLLQQSDLQTENPSGQVQESGIPADNWQQQQRRKYNKRTFGESNMALRSSTKKLMCIQKIPTNQSDARRLEDRGDWVEAEIQELNQFEELKTFEKVQPPSGANIIDGQFVYARKVDPITGEDKRKARYVAKGFQQKFGVDYTDTYAPTISLVSLRLLLIIALQLNLILWQFDVGTAFLNSPLTEIIYMRQPKNYDDGTGRVWLLKKAIYGLKQASAVWFAEFKNTLLSFGFKEVHADKCIFIYSHGSDYMILGLYVDDGLLAASRRELIDQLLEFLQSKYIIKSGRVKKFVGVEIDLDKEKFFLHQQTYIDKIAKLFKIDTFHKPIKSPLPKGYPVCMDDEPNEEIQPLFRSLVASLLFLSRLTRPDISFAVSVLSTKLHCPSNRDLFLAFRVLKYVQQTRDYKMILVKNNLPPKLSGFTDCNFAVEPKGLSRTGCIVYLMNNPIGWFSRLQSVPAKSTAEAEWYAIDSCLRELLWIRALLEDLYFVVTKFEIHSDNQSALAICKNLEHQLNDRTKHVERCYYLIQYYVAKDLVTLIYVPTDRQPADVFTKSFSVEKHESFLKYLHLA